MWLARWFKASFQTGRINLSCIQARNRHQEKQKLLLATPERSPSVLWLCHLCYRLREMSSTDSMAEAQINGACFRRLMSISMDTFGDTDPQLMPSHLFWNCIYLDYSTAIRADISKQNYSVCPRHWYIDATFYCTHCKKNFCFTITEQKQWYENQKFWIDSIPKQCKDCRRQIRRKKSLQREYDRNVLHALKSDDMTQKQRLIDIIDELSSFVASLPTALIESRSTLARQIAKKSDENIA